MRDLLRSRPTTEALAEIDSIAGATSAVPGYLLTAKDYDVDHVTTEVLSELLRWRYAGPWDHWRAL